MAAAAWRAGWGGGSWLAVCAVVLAGLGAAGGARAGELPGVGVAPMEGAPVYLTGPQFPGTLPRRGRGYRVGEGPVVLDIAVSTRHVARVSQRVSDQDFYQYVRVGLRPMLLLRPEQGGREGASVSGAIFFRFADDVDGGPRDFRFAPGPDPFRDILDAELRRRNLAPRLYTGYVQVDGLPGRGRLRLGRQYVSHTAPYQMDGGHLAVRLGRRAEAYAYAGRPVTYFFNRGGTSLVGAGGSARPWRRTRVEVEYTRAETDAGEDNLVTLGAERALGRGVRLRAQLRELDTNPWDVTLRLSGSIRPLSIFARVRYRQVLSDVGRHTFPVAPLSALLGAERRLENVTLELSRPLAAGVELNAGAQAQVVAGRERFASRDYRRFFISVDLAELPWRGAFVTPSIERWETRDDETTELGLRWTQVISRHLEAWVGSDYARFLFDFLRQRERESVRLYYAGALWRLRPGLELGFDIEAEENAIPTREDPLLTLTGWVNYAFH